MSVVFSGTFSGTFTSNGLNTFIPLPSGVDWMWVFNETVEYAGGAGNVAQSYWRNGMPQGQGTKIVKEATIGALVPSQFAANTGFFLQNTSVNQPGAFVAVTAISGANPPVVSTGNTAGLIANSTIVRLYSTVGATQLDGLDFTVGTIVANTSFTLAFMPAIAAAAAPGANAGYRIIPFLPYFYPSYRYITKISQAFPAIVTLSVTHNYTIGQKIRFIIPTVTATTYGMTQLNQVEATIVNINQADADAETNTITVDVDTTGFTAFAFPLTGGPAFTPAMVIPVGENTSQALKNTFFPALSGQNILGDATVNTAQIGMLLVGGAASPAGANNAVINWIAGKSFNL